MVHEAEVLSDAPYQFWGLLVLPVVCTDQNFSKSKFLYDVRKCYLENTRCKILRNWFLRQQMLANLRPVLINNKQSIPVVLDLCVWTLIIHSMISHSISLFNKSSI